MGISDDLSKLAALRDKGVLTQEEFDEQKARLLAGSGSDEPPLPPKNKSRLGKGCLIVIGIIVVIFIILGMIGSKVEDGGGNVAAPDGSTDANVSEEAETKPSAPEAGVTMENFNRVRNGMTYAQVVAILGEPSQELSRSEMAGIETVMYQWDGGFVANMNAMFQNGKLISKAQMGLR